MRRLRHHENSWRYQAFTQQNHKDERQWAQKQPMQASLNLSLTHPHKHIFWSLHPAQLILEGWWCVWCHVKETKMPTTRKVQTVAKNKQRSWNLLQPRPTKCCLIPSCEHCPWVQQANQTSHKIYQSDLENSITISLCAKEQTTVTEA